MGNWAQRYAETPQEAAEFAETSALLGTILLTASGKGKGKMLHERVRLINNRLPINAEHAGKLYPFEKLTKELRAKYPHSVPFTGTGHPDFSRYAVKKVQIQFSGDTQKDFRTANKICGYAETPGGYTWHHVQDQITMLLIPKDIHKAVRHTGGTALTKGR